MPVQQSLSPELIARIKRLDLKARLVVEGFLTGLHKSPYHGFSVEFAEHREYSPGDNIKYLDWTAYARSDRLYVKQFEEETNLKAHILLDTSSSMTYSSGGPSKLEYGSFLAAALAYLMVRQQDSVGLVTFDSEVRNFIPPRASSTHLNVLLRQLETLTPGGPTQVSAVFHRLAESIHRRGLIIIISDLYDDPREVLRALRHFRHKRHEVLLFHVFDSAELRFPFDRMSNFIDLETDENLQVDPKYLRNEYLAQMDRFVNSYRMECSESRIEYVLTDTSVPYELMLTAYLGKRKRLG
jgi:uncharacterized protein (DUF58 family)